MGFYQLIKSINMQILYIYILSNSLIYIYIYIYIKDKSSADCGRGKTYTSCLPQKNGVQPPDDHCGDPYNTHNRECRPQPT